MYTVRKVSPSWGTTISSNSASAEAFEGFGGRILLAALGRVQSLTYVALNRPGEAFKVFPG